MHCLERQDGSVGKATCSQARSLLQGVQSQQTRHGMCTCTYTHPNTKKKGKYKVELSVVLDKHMLSIL